MTNWFEDNPTKSIISYTLLIVGSTWAVSTFILQDNRVNLLKGELDSQKALTEQYKSKSEVNQRDIESLRSEISEYKNWLNNTKDAIPAIIPKITELRGKISTLELELAQQKINKLASTDFPINKSIRIGTAFIHEETGAVISLIQLNPDRTAIVSINIPNQSKPIKEMVNVGKQWTFNYENHDYKITITSISYGGDYIDINIQSSAT